MVQSIPQLVQVHVISRHGSRVALEVSSGQEVKETTSVILTPFGEKQMYDLGTWLRNRYAVADTLLLDDHNNFAAHDVHFESSNVECTIASANALSLGLFPPADRALSLEETMLPSNTYPGIPVYMHDALNDIFIQAYDKCPNYDKALEDLYASDSWKQMEDDHRTLLTQLGQVSQFKSFVKTPTNNNADGGYIPLSDVWKAFDVIHMSKNECAAASSTTSSYGVYCQFDPLDDTAWAELQRMTHTAEFEKYSNTTAKDWLGANLLYLLHARMGGHVDSATSTGTASTGSSSGSGRKLHLYSAHYQTILSVFAALNISPPTNEVIPGFGAALIFELYKDPSTGTYSIYMLYKEGNSSNDMSIRFPSDGPCQGSVSCPLPSFTELLASMSYTSLEEWCLACGNESANVCLQAKLDSVLHANAGGGGGVPTTTATDPGSQPSVLSPSPPGPTPWTPTADDNPQQQEELPVGTICNTTATTPCSISNTSGMENGMMIAGLIVGAFLGGISVGMLLLRIVDQKRARKRRNEAVADRLDPDDLIHRDYSDREIT